MVLRGLLAVTLWGSPYVHGTTWSAVHTSMVLRGLLAVTLWGSPYVHGTTWSAGRNGVG